MSPAKKSQKMDAAFEKIGALSKLQRMLIFGGVFVLFGGLFFWLMILPKWGDIDKLEKDLKKLETELAKAKKTASQFDAFKVKMEKARADFLMASKSLPDKEEIPSLLTNISRSGQDAGLDFLLFQPGGEGNKGFYAEIPVSINVEGTYHEVALFFDKVAQLYRLVNVTNFSMSPKPDGALSTTCTAVTYKFLEPKPSPPPGKGSAKIKQATSKKK